MNIDDIKISITEMSRQNAFDLIMSIRANRRVSKKIIVPKKEKSTKTQNSKPKKKSLDIASIISNLTLEQRTALLQSLGE